MGRSGADVSTARERSRERDLRRARERGERARLAESERRARGASAGGSRVFATAAVIGGLVVVPTFAFKLAHTGSAGNNVPAAVTRHHARAAHGGPPHQAVPQPQYPSPAAITAASAYLSSRLGENGFAVLDTTKTLTGYHMHETFTSASVVKAMLLVAYLRHLQLSGRGLDSGARALLYPMIHTSDNNAAGAVWNIVGDSGLEDVAQRAKMTEFSLGHDWANEAISPADQARLFFRINRLISPPFRAYARELLENIDPQESWGIPAVARPQWTAYFKGGWRRTGLGHLVHQVARLEQPNRTIELAVMTDGGPSMGYGIETIEGVTARLLGRSGR